MANYLKCNRWRPGEPWALRWFSPQLPTLSLKASMKLSVAEWQQKHGVRMVGDGSMQRMESRTETEKLKGTVGNLYRRI
ncbi:hypothetical protein CLOM_g13134 [Closterium sp. NIES-68]|nr:hypothetical protein CLOM_g13134 [Closterium sp. NIES-68]